jgi:hypothetical protein
VPHEWIDAPKQVVGRDAVLKIEEIKELVLIPVLPTHHDQVSAAANRQQTESLVAKNHEGFFNIIDPNPTSAQCAQRTITQFRTIAPFCVISTARTTSSPETILPQSALQPPWYGGFNESGP